jgi:hypothetical protein
VHTWHAVYRVVLHLWGQWKEAPGRGRWAEVAWCGVGAELGPPLWHASRRSLDLLSGVRAGGPRWHRRREGRLAAAAMDGWVGGGGRLLLKQKLGRPGSV